MLERRMFNVGRASYTVVDRVKLPDQDRSRLFYPFNATLRPSFFTVSRPTTPFYQRRRRLTRRRPDRIYFDVARADAIRLTRPIFRSRYGRILKGMRGGSTTKHFFSRFHRDDSKVRCNESQHAN